MENHSRSNWEINKTDKGFQGDFEVIHPEPPEVFEVKYPSIGLTLQCVLNTDKHKIQDNIKTNLKRNHERVWPYQPQETEIVLCAGGPSLLSSFDEIRQKQSSGAKVVALANVAHVLAEEGIHYSAQVLLDAKPRNREFILNGIETKLFIASQCDPGVFDAAESTGNKVYIYHAVNNDEEFQCIKDAEDMWVPIQGGSTITMRAIRLFNILGYSNFHIYGWDSCYLGGAHHAYQQPDADKQAVYRLQVEDKIFPVSSWMISQAFEFVTFAKKFCMNLNLNVHGDGLISHIIKTGSTLIK